MSQPSWPARASLAALLGAVTLAGPTSGTAPAAAPDPGPGEARPRLSARADALYREVARATARYEAARRETAAQRTAVKSARRALGRGQRRLAALRTRLGGIARSQYRYGAWSAGARMALTRTPDALLEQLRAERQARHALAGLLASARGAERRLERQRARTRAELRRLETGTRLRAAARTAVERRLALAREARGAAPVREPKGGCPHGDPPKRRPKPGAARAPRWTAPVAPRDYELSAGYASAGARWSQGHTGQDFAVESGTPVRAVGAGRVWATGCGDGFGNQVVIRHPDGYYTQYAHLSEIQTERGRRVRAGERIGLSGDTGNSTGPHLHFEARVTPYLGSEVAPEPWLRERGVEL
ncbi:M23 family metallopeptidase [Streptomyces boncukensis]|uniref:Peptidoglycan DD-metalloendopeptidase family protein n=1 Tax=Streptomyces boncukensis TaxID=2711219 RepID=A0A6G4X2D7_9ACTN|nr:peptidoglycan DD-metalloendopeptidase family protein [Streptomyces boncukensis]NGO71665.1 peptidoglycan DD-metalloendopeptidase family protein [Streptomyces boncukensis]